VRYLPADLPGNASHWIEEIQLVLGIWHGSYQAMKFDWLRWYNADGVWLATQEEVIAQERQRANQERQRAEEASQKPGAHAMAILAERAAKASESKTLAESAEHIIR